MLVKRAMLGYRVVRVVKRDGRKSGFLGNLCLWAALELIWKVSGAQNQEASAPRIVVLSSVSSISCYV